MNINEGLKQYNQSKHQLIHPCITTMVSSITIKLETSLESPGVNEQGINSKYFYDACVQWCDAHSRACALTFHNYSYNSVHITTLLAFNRKLLLFTMHATT